MYDIGGKGNAIFTFGVFGASPAIWRLVKMGIQMNVSQHYIFCWVDSYVYYIIVIVYFKAIYWLTTKMYSLLFIIPEEIKCCKDMYSVFFILTWRFIMLDWLTVTSIMLFENKRLVSRVFLFGLLSANQMTEQMQEGLNNISFILYDIDNIQIKCIIIMF